MPNSDLLTLAKAYFEAEKNTAILREKYKNCLREIFNTQLVWLNDDYCCWYEFENNSPKRFSIDYPDEIAAIEAYVNGTIEWEP